MLPRLGDLPLRFDFACSVCRYSCGRHRGGNMQTTPAVRIYTIHQRLINKGRPDSHTMRDVWAEVFDIPKGAPHLDDWVIEIDRKSTRLNSSHRQISSTKIFLSI